MHRLVELHNVETLLNEAEKFAGENGLVTGVAGLAKSIFKFDIISVCEVFGYQIAWAFGVRVPRMQGVWTKEVVRVGSVYADPGRIGVLVEYLEGCTQLSRDDAATLDPGAVAPALALCVFDRFEWGEFVLSGDKLYFVDLERLLPPIPPETLVAASPKDRVECLRNLEDQYSRGNLSAIREVLEEAERLGLHDQVEEKLRRLCSLRAEVYFQFLEISGHPLDELLSKFAGWVFGNRLNSIAEWFDLATHEVPAWCENDEV
jgi:hypothetical protein